MLGRNQTKGGSYRVLLETQTRPASMESVLRFIKTNNSTSTWPCYTGCLRKGLQVDTSQGHTSVSYSLCPTAKSWGSPLSKTRNDEENACIYNATVFIRSNLADCRGIKSHSYIKGMKKPRPQIIFYLCSLYFI